MSHAKKSLIFLILGSLGLSLTACGGKDAFLVRHQFDQCHRPAPLTASQLPALDRELLLEEEHNINTLMARHNLMRQHIQSQEAALDCYEAQIKAKGE